MPDNTEDIMGKLNEMLNSNNMPDNIKEIMSNLSNSNNNSNSNSSENRDNNTNNNNLNISPEMISSFMSSFGGSNNNTSNSDDTGSSMPNIDIATMMKIKSAMEKMNNKDDPRSKLLLSLKPYLRNERKDKVEQYVKLLGMGKMIDVFGLTGGGKAK